MAALKMRSTRLFPALCALKCREIASYCQVNSKNFLWRGDNPLVLPPSRAFGRRPWIHFRLDLIPDRSDDLLNFPALKLARRKYENRCTAQLTIPTWRTSKTRELSRFFLEKRTILLIFGPFFPEFSKLCCRQYSLDDKKPNKTVIHVFVSLFFLIVYRCFCTVIVLYLHFRLRIFQTKADFQMDF